MDLFKSLTTLAAGVAMLFFALPAKAYSVEDRASNTSEVADQTDATESETAEAEASESAAEADTS